MRAMCKHHYEEWLANESKRLKRRALLLVVGLWASIGVIVAFIVWRSIVLMA